VPIPEVESRNRLIAFLKKFFQEKGSAGGGDVYVSGTPANNQVSTWTDSVTIKGETGLTFDGSTLTVTGDATVTGDTTLGEVSVDNLGVSAKIFHVGDTDTYINFTDDDINIQAGGVNFIDITQDTVSEITFNEAGANVDFRVEGDTEQNLLFVDASADKVGIGTDAPDYDLDVAGDIGVNEKLIHNGDPDTYVAFPSANTLNLVAGGHSFVKYENSTGKILINNGNQNRDTQVMADDGNVVLHVDAGDNTVGIGTDAPAAVLEIAGDSAQGKATLTVTHTEDTDNAVDISADSITTAKALHISADALTTGNALYVDDDSSDTSTRTSAHIIQNNDAALATTALTVQSDGGATGVKIDKNYLDTTAASVTGLYIDFDKKGTSTSNNYMYGLYLDMDNNTPTDGTNYMYGLVVTPTLTHAANAGTSVVYGALINAQAGSNGSSFCQGARIEAGGGDINYGLQLDVEDGGVDLRIESSADNGDYFQIQTTTAGATTITTVDDGGTAADLTFTVDGDITLDATAGAGTTTITSPLEVLGDISGSGQLTMEGQPAFSVYANSDQTTVANQWMHLSGNVELFDVGSGYNTTSCQFTAPTTGKYLFTTSVRLDSVDSGNQYVWIRIVTSDATFYGDLWTYDQDNQGGKYATPSLTVVAHMNSGDTADVDFKVFTNTANSETLDTGYCTFMGYLLG